MAAPARIALLQYQIQQQNVYFTVETDLKKKLALADNIVNLCNELHQLQQATAAVNQGNHPPPPPPPQN